MTRRSVLRLTLWYMAILMSLSLVMSAAVYEVTRWDVNRELYYESLVLHEGNTSAAQPWLSAARSRVNLHRTLVTLAWLNAAILVAGSLVCYGLARRTLRPIDEVLGQLRRFTADASHQLRTPLSAMMLQTEVALARPQLSQAQTRQLLESNLEEMAKLEGLTSNLLRLARYEGQASPDSLTTSELADLVVTAKHTVEPLARARRMTIACDVAPLAIAGDRPSLVEALTIILGNAIKYGYEQTPVVVTGRRLSGRACLTIQNQGDGIRPADLAHVFERFWRADHSSAIDGAGLGLAVAQQIVGLHRGTISVASTPGEVTTFTVLLPFAKGP